LDLGCCPGHYTKFFLYNNIESECFDGNPNTYTISEGLCNVADLTQIHDFNQKDWVLSLEVGEHIPKEYEHIFIQNLIKHAKHGIILSWAVPGQPGDGHVNCQSNEYVISLMKENGFSLDTKTSIDLREVAELWWFKNTVMVFRKDELPKITFCIPSKSNLRYLKTCIPSIRENAFRSDHDIIVFVDSDEDGTVEWLEQVKDEYNVKYFINPDLGTKLFGIGKAYDYCIESATTEVVMIFHADMMLGRDADLNAYKHLKQGTVVCSTRIEPPLHPNAGEKILMDFGIWPEEFKKSEFNNFVDKLLIDYKDKTTEGIFAPWMIYKQDLLSIGGHDPILKSAREDSDLFNRFVLNGYSIIQSWDSLVYHLTGRGGQFQHGKVTHDEAAKSAEWQKLMMDSTKEFIRKWGSSVNHTPMMMPIIIPKYDIAFKVVNCSYQMLELLEPFCNRIFVENQDNLIEHYIVAEQPNTSYDLSKRVHSWEYSQPHDYHDIIVDINGATLTQEDFSVIQQLPLIIQDTNETGIFEIGNLKIEIIAIKETQNDLIKL
jgi:glycosyltransferase involved in cell wall biosynthesis